MGVGGEQADTEFLPLFHSCFQSPRKEKTAAATCCRVRWGWLDSSRVCSVALVKSLGPLRRADHLESSSSSVTSDFITSASCFTPRSLALLISEVVIIVIRGSEGWCEG